ncbi:serine protease inhibitor dipetalogastin-like [Pseudomyrmex gracilis]|uniref:serine protease inhibitor dipetalogastin-like n=1 Tax=Pseudomyrmex gracilis TaxID=219809 RepID=UPI00099569E2|nr:serine protease inhibitor dipetalogastin-like [Pseudomyrmex gracilis]
MSFSIAQYILFLFEIGICNKIVFALTLQDKVALYENCTIFDNGDMYGGLICGEDGMTYANSLYLDCKNHHSREIVATLHSGPCLKSEEYCSVNLHYEPVCGSDRKIYTNMQSLLCVRQKQLKDLTVMSMTECEQKDHCYRNGIEHYGVNPVCASNGFTYQNVAQLKCLQRNNPNLHIVHDGGCRVEFVRKLYGASVCKVANVIYEWNPICASDGVTYPNPFQFLCYQPRLKVIFQGECNTHSHDSCAEMQNTSANNTAEQVCGNDGLTYRNIHHLQCHTRQDKYLFLKHHGPCSGPDDQPCGSIPEEDHRQPVCGTNGKSYVSPEALWCARLRSPERSERHTRADYTDIAYKHDGPC